jgi:hypothetical protein
MSARGIFTRGRFGWFLVRQSPLTRAMRFIGVNLISRRKPGTPGRLPNSGSPSAPVAALRPSVRKGEPRLEEFLICTNPDCRFLVSLRDGSQLLRRADLILSTCPECNHEFSSRCPFCDLTLDVKWLSQVPCCANCSRPLKPETHVH